MNVTSGTVESTVHTDWTNKVVQKQDYDQGSQNHLCLLIPMNVEGCLQDLVGANWG